MVIKLPQIPQLNKRSLTFSSDGVAEAAKHIAEQWESLQRFTPEDTGTLIGLPNPYIVPAVDGGNFTFKEQYYWDSYFTAIGYRGGDEQTMVEGMLENLVVLRRRFGMIPNASRMYFTSRSQPPMLTSYIFHVYDRFEKSRAWLKEYIDEAKSEYQDVWMSTAHPHWRNIDGLSRYYDINALHDLAEAESGWDMTPRFERNCLDYYPIDLNALLYKYENDFARAAEILGHDDEAGMWIQAAEDRKALVDKLMWSKTRGMYFDYDFIKKERGATWSLAAYYALWSGMASSEQAAALVKNLSKFEQAGGLTTTTRPLVDMKNMFGSVKTQWAYPNGWAPLHYLVVEGLERYGHHERASKVARKWLATNVRWYEKHGVFLEKYNVVNVNKSPLEGVYPSQTGFGWSNSVFTVFAEKYAQID